MNRRKIPRIALALLGLFTILLITSPINLFAQEDTTPPVLEDFSFSPTLVNVATDEAIVTVTFHVTDDLSGFLSKDITVIFYSPSGMQSAGTSDSTLIDGDEYDGIYQSVITIQQFAEEGNWVVRNVSLHDQAGNGVTYLSEQLEAMGFPTELEVVSELTIDDILDFFDESVADGTIYGKGVIPFIAKIRLSVFRLSLEYASSFIEEGNIAGACNQLEEVSGKCDGEQLPPDWVLGEASPEIYDMILDLIEELGCE